MTALSKYEVEQAMANTGCSVIHPWNDKCVPAMLTMLYELAQGSFKFYVMIYIIQSIYKLKKPRKKDFPLFVRSYLRFMVSIFAYATFPATMCFSKYFGLRIPYFLTAYLGPLVASAGLFFEEAHRRTIVATTHTTGAIEAVIHQLYSTGALHKSKLREMLIVMVINAVIMYKLQTANDKPFVWFFEPKKPSEGMDRKRCLHDNKHGSVRDCLDDVIKGVLKYSAIGGLIGATRMIASNPSFLKSRRRFFKNFFQRRTFKVAAFLAVYVGLYKAVNCAQVRTEGCCSPNHSLLSGFLSGCSYWFYPSLTVFSSFILVFFRLTGGELISRKYLPPNVPYGHIIGVLSNAFLLNSRIFSADSVPKYIVSAHDTISCGRTKQLFEGVQTILNSEKK